MNDVTKIKAQALQDNEIACMWQGQLGYLMKAGETVFGLDLYLWPDEGRQVAPFLKLDELDGVDYLFGTHDHIDHIDRKAWKEIVKHNDTVKFVVPKVFAAELAEELGICPCRVLGIDVDETLQCGSLEVQAIPSAHEDWVETEEGYHPFLGYVIRYQGVTLYHTGDCCPYEGIEQRVRALGPYSAVFMPINGRDAERLNRNCLGNFLYQEAADIASRINTKLIIPGHYEMFAGNTANVDEFAAYIDSKYPALGYFIPKHQEIFIIKG